MAITGTGTQADPYKPTTWEEFLSCTATDGIYTELPEGGGTFDMNDYYPEGITTEIPLRGFINGNGWVIKNARYEGSLWAFVMSQGSSSGQIKSLNFEDFRVTTNGGNACLIAVSGYYMYSGRMLEQCKFSGRCDTFSGSYSSVLYGGGYTSEVYRCSFNIEYSGVFSPEASGNWMTQFKYCNFRLKDLDAGSTVIPTLCLNNSYLEGDMYGLSCLTTSGIVTTESVVNANISGTIRNEYAAGSKALVNTDKYSGTLPSGCIGVTTEQLTDAEYLASIGFPIQT